MDACASSGYHRMTYETIVIQNEGDETRDAFSRNRTGIGSYDLENDGVKVRGGSQVRQILTRPLDC